MDVGRRGIPAGQTVLPTRATPAAFQGELQPESATALRRRRVHRLQLALRSPLRAVVRHPWLLTLALCLLVLGVGLRGSDAPAEEYRVWLFQTFGFVLWNDQWYAGHHLLGYSLLFPPLAGLFSAALVGIVSCVVTTACMTHLVRRESGHRHDLALLWLAAAVVANLVVGRGPFALGLACASVALLSVATGRQGLARAAAAGASMASPLAGLFLLLGGLAWARTRPVRTLLPLLAALAGLVASFLFPEGGHFPFPLITLAGILLVAGIGLLVTPPEAAVVRAGLVIYALVAVVLYLVPSPIGGNMARPASLLAGPVAAIVLRYRRRVLALVVVPLLVWEFAPITAAIGSSSDPSAAPAYYQGLLDFLGTHPAPYGRVEIPFTRGHWEARFVAPVAPLARGWERQLDVRYNEVLYRPDLSSADYRAWLLSRGVRYVALPDVPLDGSAVREAGLLRAGLPFLTPVFSDAHWRVWAVHGAPGLALGSAKLTRLDVDGFTLRFPAPGTSEVLVHYSPYWQVLSGSACVSPAANGWTLVTSTAAGTVRVASRWSLTGMIGSAGSCVTGRDQAGTQ